MKSKAVNHVKQHRWGTTFAVIALGGVAAACFFGSGNFRARRSAKGKGVDDTLGAVEGFGSDWESMHNRSIDQDEERAGYQAAQASEWRREGSDASGADSVPPRNTF